MGGSDTSAAQRTRTKTPDFSELFRSAHGSRHTSRTGAGTGSGPSSNPLPGDKMTVAKAPSRRSMLPFLGRKKPAVEQPAVPVPPPLSRKSVGNAAYSITPVNTVRRSFGNGHTVLMITPSPSGVPAEPPLPSKLPSMDAHSPSLGSKLAAHFTPLRSSSSNGKARHSVMRKPQSIAPPLPSHSALSPPVPEIRAPSIESQRSAMRSRSTTPRPLRGHLSAAEHGDEEDFSDLFTLPDQLRKPQQLMTASTTSVHVSLADSSKRSEELTPTSPLTPSGPPLHFPIPPSSVVPRSILIEKSTPRYSFEGASVSSQRSGSPSKRRPPGTMDSPSNRTLHSDVSSQDERQNRHPRTTSISGSDTDTSRANDSIYSASSSRLPKPSSKKPKLVAPGVAKASSGPPPSVPLPTPPLSPSPGALGPRSVPSTPPSRVAFPRPRANTLSVTSNLVVPGGTVPKSNNSSPPRSSRANYVTTADVTIEELQEALAQQRRKNAQLQEYIGTITKRYEDDRVAMTRNIEKLERTIRKKMREIEGLRWLVIHNGAVSDIDAAASLARSSLSTQEGDMFDSVRRRSPLGSSPVSPHHDGPVSHQLVPGQKGENVTATATSSSSELRSDMSTSVLSFATSVSDTSTTTPSLSVIPERIDGISRADRQKLKEERRASKALRRISAASAFALGTDSSTVDSPLDPNFDPRQRMDEVLEKLQPFRHT